MASSVRAVATDVGMLAEIVVGDDPQAWRSVGFAVDGDGNLYAWGQNTTGELGLGDDVERDEPEQVSGIAGVAWVAASAFHTVAVDGDGNVYAWGRNDNGELGMGDVVERDTPTLVSYFGGS